MRDRVLHRDLVHHCTRDSDDAKEEIWAMGSRRGRTQPESASNRVAKKQAERAAQVDDEERYAVQLQSVLKTLGFCSWEAA